MLGVSYEDLTKDFELTSFSTYGARYRSKVSGTSFDDSGIFENTTENYIAWGKMNDLINTNYHHDSGELCAAIENYLKQECKVEQETIDAVRRNLLGKYVEFPKTEELPDPEKEFTFENGNLTKDGNITITNVTFEDKKCFKAYAPTQLLIYNETKIINKPENKKIFLICMFLQIHQNYLD